MCSMYVQLYILYVCIYKYQCYVNYNSNKFMQVKEKSKNMIMKESLKDNIWHTQYSGATKNNKKEKCAKILKEIFI